ncbi:hypothetical protein BH11PSE8_BH11PSE8_14870 [soil metagenome]
MLIHRKTSRAVDWKAVLWFALGVFVTLCVATYTHFDAAGGHAKAAAATAALEPRPSAVSAPSVCPPAASTQTTAATSSTGSGARPALREIEQPPRVVANAMETDISLVASIDVGRREMAVPAPAPESVTQVAPPDAATAHAAAPSPADVELENQLRAQSESTSPRPPSASDSALMPHEQQ